MSSENIIIFDTTLRDGEQSPGASLSVEDKVEIAHALVKLGVDIIEAGFPVSSPSQFTAVQKVAEECSAVIAALARAKQEDIEAAGNALKPAKYRRIHTFIGTSDHHVLAKFGDAKYGATLAEKRKTVLRMTQESIQQAKQFTNDVEFSAEDAFRTDLGFLVEVAIAAAEAGATTLNLPDTTGYAYPEHYAGVFKHIKERLKNNSLILSTHCHNDLGLAVANSLAAVQEGARQIECSINGIGERAGNASLEEIVMALKIREDYYKKTTHINTPFLFPTSQLVSARTGLVVQPNKAIVGSNAFAHESGIHQDGMIKNRKTYEIIEPES
ncbi:MAG: 2-isopropylmalate synthase, partial [Pseudobdellovibrionaceae bacterium]